MGDAEVDRNRAEPVLEAPRSRRRKRRRSKRHSEAGGVRRLRLIYFGLAAIWGYLAGTAAILGGLAALGKPLRLATETALLLLGAGLVAVIGGVVAAVAYRDASNRYGG